MDSNLKLFLSFQGEKNPFHSTPLVYNIEIPFKLGVKLFLLSFHCTLHFFIFLLQLWLFIYIIMSYHRAHRKQIRIMLISVSPSLSTPRSFSRLRLGQIKRFLNGIFLFCYIFWSTFFIIILFFVFCCCMFAYIFGNEVACLHKDRVNEGFIFP